MSRRGRSAWALVALVLMTALQLVLTQQCRRVAASVTVGTSRNASGHWETKILLQRNAEFPDRGAGELQLEVLPSTAMCGSTRHDAVLVTLRGPPAGPGPGYEAAGGGGYYRIHPRNATWAEAKAACEAEGAHLLLVDSLAEEQAGVVRLITAQPEHPSCYFVGFHDMDLEGHYVTIFGEPLSALGYSRWHSGQPDDYNKAEDCGTLTPTGGLNDWPCTSKTFFICEQRIS